MVFSVLALNLSRMQRKKGQFASSRTGPDEAGSVTNWDSSQAPGQIVGAPGNQQEVTYVPQSLTVMGITLSFVSRYQSYGLTTLQSLTCRPWKYWRFLA